jgi:HSP20 family protein
MVAGVSAEDLSVSVTREMATIKGKREAPKGISPENYFYQELYWGSFSRTILLPAEVETEDVEATEKHGLLSIKLPKIDKDRKQSVKIKSL